MYGRAKSRMSLDKLTMTDGQRTTDGQTEKATNRGTSFRSAQKCLYYKVHGIQIDWLGLTIST